MSVYELKTFADLVAAVREEVHIQSTDTTAINRIKRDINMTYFEIVNEHKWWWLTGAVDVQQQAYISTGTASVTTGSSSVTLSSSINGNKASYKFAVDGYDEIYTIDYHSGTTLRLSGVYAGTTNSAATFKIWCDYIPLPTDCKETIEVRHDFTKQPLESKGLQEWRRFTTVSPRAEGRPVAYYTGDFYDPTSSSAITSMPSLTTRSSSATSKTLIFGSALPSTVVAGTRLRITGAGHPSYNGDVIVSAVSTTTATNDTLTYIGNGDLYEAATADTGMLIYAPLTESNSDRFRMLFVYPALYTARTTLHVDYVKEVAPLENDDDEPVIPYEDRMVLLYAALHKAWSRVRNAEEATRNYTLYQNKLAKMAGRLQDSFDKPLLTVSRDYLRAKRSAGRTSNSGFFGGYGTGGRSGSIVTGTADTAAVFDSNGQLTSSSTISTTELGYLNGVSSNIQTQLDAITTLADGKILVGNGSNVATEVTPSGDITITNAGVTAIGAGVIVNADVNASAAIARTKLASGTAYRILANDSGGVMGENAALTASRVVESDANGQLASSVITSTELTYLDDVNALTSAVLTDNTASPTACATFTSSFTAVQLAYSITRGAANIESGIINIVNDGTSASIAQGAIASLGTLGVTFTVDVSGGNVRLLYTTTSTGTNAALKYKAQKWAA